MVWSICKDEKIIIDSTVPGVRTASDYVESWRIQLWDKAFIPFLGSKDKKDYNKKSKFSDFPGTDMAVKRVVYR
jgi:hypothetical protein